MCVGFSAGGCDERKGVFIYLFIHRYVTDLRSAHAGGAATYMWGKKPFEVSKPHCYMPLLRPTLLLHSGYTSSVLGVPSLHPAAIVTLWCSSLSVQLFCRHRELGKKPSFKSAVT